MRDCIVRPYPGEREDAVVTCRETLPPEVCAEIGCRLMPSENQYVEYPGTHSKETPCYARNLLKLSLTCASVNSALHPVRTAVLQTYIEMGQQIYSLLKSLLSCVPEYSTRHSTYFSAVWMDTGKPLFCYEAPNATHCLTAQDLVTKLGYSDMACSMETNCHGILDLHETDLDSISLMITAPERGLEEVSHRDSILLFPLKPVSIKSIAANLAKAGHACDTLDTFAYASCTFVDASEHCKMVLKTNIAVQHKTLRRAMP